MNPDWCENLPVWQPGHDWRLFSREPVTQVEELVGGGVEIRHVAWKHTWYCTKCRRLTIDPNYPL